MAFGLFTLLRCGGKLRGIAGRKKEKKNFLDVIKSYKPKTSACLQWPFDETFYRTPNKFH